VEDKEAIQPVARALTTAPHGHLSAEGNRFRAAQLFRILFDSTEKTVSGMCLSRPDSLPVFGEPAHAPLNRLKRAGLRIQNRLLDTLYAKAPGDYTWGWSRAVAWNRIGGKTALVLTDIFSDLKIIPLDFSPADGDTVYLKWTNEGKIRTEPVGRVEGWNPWVCRLRVDTGGRQENTLFIRSLAETTARPTIRPDDGISRIGLPAGTMAEICIGNQKPTIPLGQSETDTMGRMRALRIPDAAVYVVRMPEWADVYARPPGYGWVEWQSDTEDSRMQFPLLRWEVRDFEVNRLFGPVANPTN
jgi:hypothetical protein